MFKITNFFTVVEMLAKMYQFSRFFNMVVKIETFLICGSKNAKISHFLVCISTGIDDGKVLNLAMKGAW